jgi:hypothetical protein
MSVFWQFNLLTHRLRLQAPYHWCSVSEALSRDCFSSVAIEQWQHKTQEQQYACTFSFYAPLADWPPVEVPRWHEKAALLPRAVGHCIQPDICAADVVVRLHSLFRSLDDDDWLFSQRLFVFYRFVNVIVLESGDGDLDSRGGFCYLGHCPHWLVHPELLGPER